jgi:hypothetical protein
MSKDDDSGDNIIDFSREREKKLLGESYDLPDDPSDDDYFSYIPEEIMFIEMAREELCRMRRVIDVSLKKSHSMIMLNFVMLFLNIIIFMTYMFTL